MKEPLIISDQCKLIACDERELKLLREIAETVAKKTPVGYLAKLMDALEPWSKHYGECQL